MARRDEAQTVQVGLRVKEPLRALLEESATERGISMNAEIVRRLERTFEPPEHKIDLEDLRSQLNHEALHLAQLSFSLHESNPELSREIFGSFFELAAIIEFTYPPEGKHGEMQQRINDFVKKHHPDFKGKEPQK